MKTVRVEPKDAKVGDRVRGRPPRRPRPPIIEGDVARIPLGNDLYAIVDATDLPLVGSHRWHVSPSHPTPRAKIGRESVPMHRLIVDHHQTDHINGNPLDNRRCNLRAATKAQNAWNKGLSKSNKSGLKGVQRTKEGRWRADIGIDWKRVYLGTFDSPQAAARAYDDAAVAHFGEFARTNAAMGLLDSGGGA